MKLASQPNTRHSLHYIQTGSHRVINMEMESSLLFHLGQILGFECATICPIISGPTTHDKPIDYQSAIDQSIEMALNVLSKS